MSEVLTATVEAVDSAPGVLVLTRNQIVEIGDEILDTFDKEVLYEMSQGGKKVKDLLATVIFEIRRCLASRNIASIKFGEPIVVDNEDFVLCKINTYDDTLGINHWGTKQQNKMETGRNGKYPAKAPYEMATTKAMRNGIRGLIPFALIKYLKRNGRVANINNLYSVYDDVDDFDTGTTYSAPKASPPVQKFEKPAAPVQNPEEKAKIDSLRSTAAGIQRKLGLTSAKISDMIKEVTSNRTGLFTAMTVSDLEAYVEKLQSMESTPAAPPTPPPVPDAPPADTSFFTALAPEPVELPFDKPEKKTTSKSSKKNSSSAEKNNSSASSEEVMSFLDGFDD